MVEVVLLRDDTVISKLFDKPSNICLISNTIQTSWENCNWNTEILNRYKRRISCAIDLLVLDSSIIVEGILTLINSLEVIYKRMVPSISTWSTFECSVDLDHQDPVTKEMHGIFAITFYFQVKLLCKIYMMIKSNWSYILQQLLTPTNSIPIMYGSLRQLICSTSLYQSVQLYQRYDGSTFERYCCLCCRRRWRRHSCRRLLYRRHSSV